MVLVTPRLVRPLDPDEVPSLPTTPGQFLPPPGMEESLGRPGAGEGRADAPPIRPPQGSGNKG
jgi:hypothetical protein